MTIYYKIKYHSYEHSSPYEHEVYPDTSSGHFGPCGLLGAIRTFRTKITVDSRTGVVDRGVTREKVVFVVCTLFKPKPRANKVRNKRH